ncbi:hypothetical protein Y1Q_0008717 [Alligator mississippiensis]|uniref:Uncharacterized protein n=1 Tax=Alligator mississippiensis TaxID=8496 RepID=A0A151N9S5_ALLMI|nr:hypothetical protein Y1Q_0008717 [Alligator mississippiensis]
MQIAWQSLIGSGPNMKIDLAAYGGNIRVQKCIRVACDSPCYRITAPLAEDGAKEQLFVPKMKIPPSSKAVYKLFSMSL